MVPNMDQYQVPKKSLKYPFIGIYIRTYNVFRVRILHTYMKMMSCHMYVFIFHVIILHFNLYLPDINKYITYGNYHV